MVNLHQIEVHLKHFELYLLNPEDPSLSEKEKSYFFETVKKIGNKLGSSFFGLIKRQVNTQAIVAYEATEILFHQLEEVLNKRGYVSVNNVPAEFSYFPHDFSLHETYYNSKYDTYITVTASNKWFSRDYQLEFIVDKDFDFNNYKEELAEEMRSKYQSYKDDNDIYTFFDYNEHPQTIADFIQEIQPIITKMEKLTVHQLKKYW
jgi:hypothetical protein